VDFLALAPGPWPLADGPWPLASQLTLCPSEVD